jgi:ribonuclease P protein component
MNNKIITIKKREHILASKKYENYVSNKYFIIRYGICPYKCTNESIKEKSCILIVNTKKNCKTSVKRNLLKRRIKEILKNIYFTNSLVIYSKPLAFVNEYFNIKTNLIDLMEKIKNKPVHM